MQLSGYSHTRRRVVNSFGVELECDLKHDEEDLYDLMSEITESDSFFAKEDSSVSGFELVSEPFFFNKEGVQTFVEELERVMQTVPEVFDFTSEQAGGHVHLSKNMMKNNCEIKLALFFSKNFDKIANFFGRRNRSSCSFSDYRAEEIGGELKGYDAMRCDRYRPANFSNSNTVEFRVFKSTRFPSTVREHLRFLAVLMNTCNHAPIDSFLGDCLSPAYIFNKIADIYKENAFYRKRIDYLISNTVSNDLFIRYYEKAGLSKEKIKKIVDKGEVLCVL